MKNLIKNLANLPALKTNKKLIIFLSDDWGSVRMKSVKDQEQLVEKGFKIKSRFDQYDTLESDEDLERLFDVLLSHKDYKGNHPVITAVSNVANPDFQKIKEEDFQNYYFESVEETYQRYPASGNVMQLIQKGIQQKIFIPESHGREHLQVNWYLQELKNENSFARKAFDNEFFFLSANLMDDSKRGRGVGAAFDVWNENDIASHLNIISTGLNLFEELYGCKSNSFTPPAMFYSPKIENKLVEKGIKWLDVGRFFKIPQVGGGERYQYNYLGKKKNSGLKVLVRNCVFESNMSNDNDGVTRCLQDIEEAFRIKQPALISNHRASFVGGIDVRNRDIGIKALDSLITEILKKWPDAEFATITDLDK